MSQLVPDSVLEHMRNAQRVVVLTGGGVASEAKFLSFREAHSGAWAKYDVSELATPQAYLRNPRLVWEWYEHRRISAAVLEPAATHKALARLEPLYQSFMLVTQTIDGLHARAGSQNVVELNGSLHRSRCFEAGHPISVWEDIGEVPPRCPHCGSLLRPDVVMYGEGLPEPELRRVRKSVESCDLFLCLGNIGAIEPVASFPLLARRARARVIVIAPEDSIYALMADDVVPVPPGDVLPDIVQALAGDSEQKEQVA
jgi:NAD-dependent deacetylase